MTNTSKAVDMITLAVDLVSAYVSNNHVQPGDMGKLIADVHGALLSLSAPAASAPEPVAKASPSEIRRSVTPEALISFEDGKPYKTLRRHLTTRDLTPETYRAKWGLPGDYPMVAPSYSERRSALARSIGLGRPGSLSARADEVQVRDEPVVVESTAPKGRRGRKAA